jgi:hypothetical protein
MRCHNDKGLTVLETRDKKAGAGYTPYPAPALKSWFKMALRRSLISKKKKTSSELRIQQKNKLYFLASSLCETEVGL